MAIPSITAKYRVYQLIPNYLVIVPIVILNLYWGIRGLSPYIPQTNGVLFILWIFIPDCPLYALLFAGLIINRKKIKNFQLLFWIVTLSLIKFSLAAPSLFLHFPEHYRAPPIFGIQLPNIFPFDYFHLFLLIQSIIFTMLFLEKSIRNFLIAYVWILLNDFIDFVFFTFPYYYLTYSKIESLLGFYLIVNFIILGIGLFFTLNVSSNIRELVRLPKREIARVPILTSSMVEEGDF
ncbi:MAG: DUF1405 domain-containing protein [Candidatus Hodarchaeota archaeon]